MKTFKKIFFVVIILNSVFGIINTKAQSPDWLWAKANGGMESDMGKSITRDKNGNLYVTGNYRSPSLIFGTDSLTNSDVSGTYDIFVVKYDPDGNVLWASTFGGGNNGNDDVRDIALDSAGNIYIAGGFRGNSITFGGRTHYNSNKDSADIFFVKFDPLGNVLWSQSSGGRRNDIANSISCDRWGNLYVIGAYGSSTLSLGSHPISNPEDIFGDEHDMFIAKFDSEGAAIWAQTVEVNDYYETKYKITTDITGNIIIAGYFASSTITFGEHTLTNYDKTGKPTDIFIVKLDTEGKVLWATSYGGKTTDYQSDMTQAVTTDLQNNIIITGLFYSPTINFDTLTLKNHNTPSYPSMFVVKLDSNGKAIWAKSSLGGGDAGSSAVALDTKGNIYITGYFIIQPIQFGLKKLYVTGNYDAFVVKYDPMGEAMWAQSIGGSSDEVLNGITVDETGNAYVTGYYLSPTVSIGSRTFYQEGYGDMFIAKLSANPTTVMDNITPSDIVTLFPNPTKSTFHISGIEPGNWNISIYSLTGEKIYESLLRDSQTIDLSGRAKGIYVYQLQKDGEILKTGKIALE